MITFAYPYVLFGGLAVWLCWSLFLLIRKHSSVKLVYPLVGFNNFFERHALMWPPKILSLLRVATVFLLVLLSARPQVADDRSRITVNGVDIVLTLDVSGSMELIDDTQDQRNRLQVAKDETGKFIERRVNDAMGVVVFGADALSLCPLTLDKKLLKETVRDLAIGKVVSADGTYLGTGLATAINRLRSSKAKSRVIVLLTDGKPTADDLVSVDQALELARMFGIKIYTIGVGSETSYFRHPQFNMIMPVGNQQSFDLGLLKRVADETGGMCFEARKPADLERIYQTIDKLEKTEQETTIFNRRYEAFAWFAFLLMLVLGADFALRYWWWRGCV